MAAVSSVFVVGLNIKVLPIICLQLFPLHSEYSLIIIFSYIYCSSLGSTVFIFMHMLVILAHYFVTLLFHHVAFSFCLKKFLGILHNACLLVVNSLCFCLSEKISMLP